LTRIVAIASEIGFTVEPDETGLRACKALRS
jgi:hypothetical protein